MAETKLIGRPRDTPSELRSALGRPEDRPQSAAELDRLLAGIEIEPWSEEEATQWWRQHQPA